VVLSQVCSLCVRPRKQRPPAAADVGRQSSVIDTWSDERTVTRDDVERRGVKRKTAELERFRDEPDSDDDDDDDSQVH